MTCCTERMKNQPIFSQGRGGYKADIFNDQRGRFQGQAYGERVLGSADDSSVLGTKFNWNNANDNARAALDVHKEFGRGSGVSDQFLLDFV